MTEQHFDKDGNFVCMGDYIYYPYSKAVCQAIMVEVPKLQTKEVTYDELVSFKSERMFTKLGQSNK